MSRWFGCLALPSILLVAIACNFGTTEGAKEIEEMVRSYYDAVQRTDAEGQVRLWVAYRHEEARRQAQAWSNRSKEDLKLSSFHVQSTEDSSVKIVHYYLSTRERKAPEGKAALVEEFGGIWQIREIR